MKFIVITGSTKGIGLGMAEEFLKRGHAVTLSSRSTKAVAEEAQRLGRSHGSDRVLGHPCDVSAISQVQSLWDAAHRQFGKIDVWVNNAGLTNSVRKVWEIDPAEAQAVVTTNLLGLIYGCQIAVQGMLKQGFGQIYNFFGHGSTDELRPGGLTLYGTARGALFHRGPDRGDAGYPGAGRLSESRHGYHRPDCQGNEKHARGGTPPDDKELQYRCRHG